MALRFELLRDCLGHNSSVVAPDRETVAVVVLAHELPGRRQGTEVIGEQDAEEAVGAACRRRKGLTPDAGRPLAEVFCADEVLVGVPVVDKGRGDEVGGPWREVIKPRCLW